MSLWLLGCGQTWKILAKLGITVNRIYEDTGYRKESIRKLYHDEMTQRPRDLLTLLWNYLNVDLKDLINFEEVPETEMFVRGYKPFNSDDIPMYRGLSLRGRYLRLKERKPTVEKYGLDPELE